MGSSQMQAASSLSKELKKTFCRERFFLKKNVSEPLICVGLSARGRKEEKTSVEILGKEMKMMLQKISTLYR